MQSAANGTAVSIGVGTRRSHSRNSLGLKVNHENVTKWVFQKGVKMVVYSVLCDYGDEGEAPMIALFKTKELAEAFVRNDSTGRFLYVMPERVYESLEDYE